MIRNKALSDYIYKLILADSIKNNKPLSRELGLQVKKQLDNLSYTKEFDLIDCLLRMNRKRG
ncbi:MAG: hypothetical protein J6S85_04720 [Methanobrevibacter sp.]|nr:hypothetical protein [Methanobrevibacter sp.]